MSGCEAKLDSGNLARAGRERFESQRQNLMNYATENLVDGGFYFLFIFFFNARGMPSLFFGVEWLPSFLISPWLKLIDEVTYSFSVDFAAVLTLVPAFHVAILVFPICHAINLFQSLNLQTSSCQVNNDKHLTAILLKSARPSIRSLWTANAARTYALCRYPLFFSVFETERFFIKRGAWRGFSFNKPLIYAFKWIARKRVHVSEGPCLFEMCLHFKG